MRIYAISFLFVVLSQPLLTAQENFSQDPLDVRFIRHDFDNFYSAFDKLETTVDNPFEEYLDDASIGLKPFVDYLNADSLLTIAHERKTDYEAARDNLEGLPDLEKRVSAIYSAFGYWYEDAIFPPIYFVVGRFYAGGTVSENGLLIGSELLDGLDGLPKLIAHELIHFQQNIKGDDTLLKQSLIEGSADFLGELTSGIKLDGDTFHYGRENEETLFEQFSRIMLKNDYKDWLYVAETNEDRPKDLGYWIGYRITESYFNVQTDKKEAVRSILNIDNPLTFLRESKLLEKYFDR